MNGDRDSKQACIAVAAASTGVVCNACSGGVAWNLVTAIFLKGLPATQKERMEKMEREKDI